MIEIRELEGRLFRLPHAVVPAGELTAVVAPSFACAREFVDLVLGLAAPRSGVVRLFGQEMSAADEPARLGLRARLGFVSQAEGLIDHLALWENVLLGVSYHRGRDATAVDARARTLLGWCGWPEDDAQGVLQGQPDRATPFQRAIVAWLRALLGEPELLMCEDIFSLLAPEQRRRLIDASVTYQAENPTRSSVFVLVGDRLLDELQPTSVHYLSLRGDFRAEAQA